MESTMIGHVYTALDRIRDTQLEQGSILGQLSRTQMEIIKTQGKIIEAQGHIVQTQGQIFDVVSQHEVQLGELASRPRPAPMPLAKYVRLSGATVRVAAWWIGSAAILGYAMSGGDLLTAAKLLLGPSL